MRKIREVLRLYFAAALSIRAIARSVGTSPSTVADYLRRAEGSGLSWPVPEAIDDVGLERRTVSGIAAEQPVASAAGVERGAPGVGAEGCDAVVAVAGVQGAPPGGAAVQLVSASSTGPGPGSSTW